MLTNDEGGAGTRGAIPCPGLREEDNLVAFLQTLTEGFTKPNPVSP